MKRRAANWPLPFSEASCSALMDGGAAVAAGGAGVSGGLCPSGQFSGGTP